MPVELTSQALQLSPHVRDIAEGETGVWFTVLQVRVASFPVFNANVLGVLGKKLAVFFQHTQKLAVETGNEVRVYLPCS